MVCTFYLHGAKKTEAYLQGTITLFIKNSIVFILLKRYNTTPFRHLSTVPQLIPL